jgi:hypothetical protein
VVGGTLASQVNPNEVIFNVSDRAPVLTAADASSATGIKLSFDRNVIGSPIPITGPGAGAGWNTGAEVADINAKDFTIPVSDVPPTLQTIGVGGGGISLQFDTHVAVGTPDKSGNGVGWDLALVYSTGFGSLAMVVNDVPPDVSAIITGPSGIELDFSLPIGTVATPTNGAPPAVQVTSATKPDEKTLVLAAVAPVPKIDLVESDSSGISLSFDAPVNTDPALKPIVGKAPAPNITDVTQADPETIRLAILPPRPYPPGGHAKYDNVPEPPEGGKASSTNPPPSPPKGSAKPE